MRRLDREAAARLGEGAEPGAEQREARSLAASAPLLETERPDHR